MIEKNFIILIHSAQVIARGVIAHASPTGLSLGDKVRPRIGRWFLFHEPEIFHAVMSNAPIIVVIPSEVEESRCATSKLISRDVSTSLDMTMVSCRGQCNSGSRSQLNRSYRWLRFLQRRLGRINIYLTVLQLFLQRFGKVPDFVI